MFGRPEVHRFSVVKQSPILKLLVCDNNPKILFRDTL
jgi:hypothetical protein